MYHYSVYTELALKYGISFNAWEDGGDFKIYDRAKRSWNDIKDILIYTSDSSTTQLKITQVEDKINLTWQLRSKTIDSIRIERKNSSGIFQTISTLPGNATSFSDENTEAYKTYYYRVVAKYANGITIPSYPISGFKIATQRSPFSGTPISIPGTIEAENFDEGGELLTFHDADFVNTPGKYRTNVGVDIMSREDGGFQVTNITAGEWLEYTINIAEAGDYVIDTWVSSVEGGGKFSYLIGKIGVASITVPKTQDIQTLVKTTTTRSLNAGEQIMRLKLNSIPTFAIDRIEISKPNISVNELKNGNSCSVYSPIQGIVTVELKDETPADILIYNTMGQKELNSRLKQGLNEIGNLTSGVYFYKVINESGTIYTGKVSIK